MRITHFGIGAVLAVAACSSAPEIPNDLPTGRPMRGTAPTKTTSDAGTRGTNNGGSEADNEGELPPSSEDAGAPDPGPAPTPDAGTTTGTCSATTGQDACYTCCEDTNPGALDILDQAFGNCICDASACGNACATTACNGIAPAPGSTCDQCIGAYYGTCDQYATSRCQNNATCAKMLACDQASGCAQKPGP